MPPSGLLAKLVILGLHFMYVYDWSRFCCVVLHVKEFINKISCLSGSRVQ